MPILVFHKGELLDMGSAWLMEDIPDESYIYWSDGTWAYIEVPLTIPREYRYKPIEQSEVPKELLTQALLLT